MKHWEYILLWILLNCLGFPATAQEFIAKQKAYQVIDGLPHREINAIHQDRQGFIWVGSPQGLGRFDGYQFTTYNKASEGFQNNNIWRILEDSEGWFWLIPLPPFDDFDIWHPQKRALTSFRKKFGEQVALPQVDPGKWCVSPNDQRIVVGTDHSSLLVYHPYRGLQTIPLKGISRCAVIAAGEHIWAIADDTRLVELDWQGNVLQIFSHSNPLNFERELNNRSLPFVYFEENKSRRSHSFLINRQGRRQQLPKDYWFPVVLPGLEVSTIGEDLLLDDFHFFNMNGGGIYEMPRLSEPKPESVYRSLFFDRRGNLWLGGNFGLKVFSVQKNNFQRYLFYPPGNESAWLATRGIWADSTRLLANQEFSGPMMIDLSTGQEQKIITPKEGFGYLCAFKFPEGGFAIGHFQAIIILDEAGKLRSSSATSFKIWSMFGLSGDTLLLGTDGGLKLFDKSTLQIQPFEKLNGFTELSTTQIMHMARDKSGRLWLCTDKGLFRADASGNIQAHYSDKGKGQYFIPHNVIYHFYEDPTGALWLASGGGGIIRLAVNAAEEKTPAFRQFTQTKGLSNDVIYAVYPDKTGNLWLSSDKGIMRFDTATSRVKTYLEQDGISNNEFNRISHFQAPDGRIYFGGLNGVTTFYPEALLSDEDLPEPNLAIVSFRQFDGKQGRMVERTAALLASQTIVLQPKDNFFNLEVSLLSFQEALQNRYAYKLEGLEQDWTYTQDHLLRFGRLPFGEYRLHIKAQDERGRWSKQALHIRVLVLKPFYLKRWFIALMAGVFVAGIIAVYKIRIKQLSVKQKELEQMVEERTHQIQADKQTIEKQAVELQSLERLKSRFFANVSHELRTPLTLILGPLNSLLQHDENRSAKELNLLKLVQKNSAYLLKLVNEILDLSKLESGRLEVKEAPVNLHQFLLQLVAQFSSLDLNAPVKLNFHYHADPALTILMDAGKFEKILHNYLSNALKFTPPGGEVMLSVEDQAPWLLVKVQDSGPGIHIEDLPYIFDRFFQSKQPDAVTQGGTGIGLSLAKELAELLGGQVWAESEPGKGSTFYFRFPKRETTMPDLSSAADSRAEVAPELDAKPMESEKLAPRKKGPKATILMVEDNPDLRSYIQTLLDTEYLVETAENGQVALNRLMNSTPQSLPDLIISDLMMPIMDGFTLLENIKGQDSLRHLPVIMLTARTDVRVKLRALRIGVDDYLTKPFVAEELKIRIDNLLRHHRERLAAAAIENKKSPENKPVIAAADAEWLEQVEAIFEKYLNEPQFTMDWAASQLNLSTRQFTRRLKQLTGLTPNHYLREIRLQTAKDLLYEGRYTTVKEVGFAIGFSDTAYFSQLFQERFGIIPSDYLR